MVTCYIAIGSNLGDRKQYIESAIRRVRTLANTKVRRVSRIIETAPQGGPAQGAYLNAVFEIDTDLTPYQLLQELQRIETALGRVRRIIDGPRTIDLDILTYGDVIMSEPALCIPHPRMLQRQFVLVPLGEIAPQVLAGLLKKRGARKSKKAPGTVSRKRTHGKKSKKKRRP
ncbi:MAG: 2-amino-4-hydroxy-6-hydroxymethyldihydropteridine diphosphokinase [Candidatus Omnitrophica bacterium]|nr:2-amino-4-hydroxy-6-hydroxymethyldihydropteridine diphosphokinase [Candidatus Omnitrophota bacterium]